MRRRGLLGNLGAIEDPAAIKVAKAVKDPARSAPARYPPYPNWSLAVDTYWCGNGGRSRVFPPRVLGMWVTLSSHHRFHGSAASAALCLARRVHLSDLSTSPLPSDRAVSSGFSLV